MLVLGGHSPVGTLLKEPSRTRVHRVLDCTSQAVMYSQCLRSIRCKCECVVFVLPCDEVATCPS